MTSLLSRLEALGHWFFYAVLQLFGHRAAIVLLRGILLFYVTFSRKIHRVTKHYLSRRFTEQSSWASWRHTYRNVFSFGQVLVERGWLGLKEKAQLKGRFEGYETFRELLERGQGIVLLTGHVGNWQSALAHLDRLPVTVHVLMQYDNEAVAKHYFDLKKKQRSFNIINSHGDFGGMVEALAALQAGDVVTIMGDRYTRGSCSNTVFLGDSARVPDGAYLLAASAKAPVAVIFAAKTGMDTYQLKLWDHFYPSYSSRSERKEMMQECSARYCRALEDYVKEYPYQWYNFYDFWNQ